jgi:LuxR family maltose regulon positive regulatory protein
MVLPLLTTKLNIPPLRRSLVHRPRLVERLNAGLHRRLTLISTPAGFGKTSLLAEWARSQESRARVAWLSLDQGDNDPARFLAYLMAALQTGRERLGEGVARGFESSESNPSEMALTSLINEISTLPDPLILCLDDYHLITDQPVHDDLTFLVEHAPDNMHLVVASRSDPPLSLARLRARGQLTELRQTDLRFTVEEAAKFLNDVMGLDLSPADVAALEARTEGWIAGLQMAALAIQGIAERGRQPVDGVLGQSGFVRAFTGSHRFILDYLIEEVLDQQPSAMQEFLLKTSILERLTGPLCDAVLGNGAGGQENLESLERANLFIVPLDEERRWYRYHRLFSDLLRKRLRQTYPDLVPVLHGRASQWHEQQGLMAAAIDHALDADDLDRAAALIEESVEATFMRSEVSTYLHWVERLPEESMRTRPTLCFFHAWALLMTGLSVEVVEQRLQDMACVQDGAEIDDVLPGRMAALHAYVALMQADMQRAAELSSQAMERLPESAEFLRSLVAWILSLAQLFDTDLRESSLALQQVARKGQEIGNPLIAVTALCYQAKLQARQGRLHRTHEILERALRLATDQQGRRLPIASEALIGLGVLWREWNELDAAETYLAEGIELSGEWSELASFDAYLPLARIRVAQGNLEGAREALDTARRIALRSEATMVDDLVVDLQHAYLSVRQGDAERAMHWAERWGLVPDVPAEPGPDSDEGQDFVRDRLRKYEHLVLVRLYLIQDRAAEALGLLESLLAQARDLGRVDLTIETQILRALAFQAEGNDAQAIDALAEALSLAEPGGFLRIFLDEGPSMADLLRQARSRGIAPAYTAKLLAAFEGPESEEMAVVPQTRPPQPLLEPLSERELQVLGLLATGMSNPEIAEELFIAVSTVRSHCKSIYGKLDVHRRWDAVHRAQELGLI